MRDRGFSSGFGSWAVVGGLGGGVALWSEASSFMILLGGLWVRLQGDLWTGITGISVFLD